MVFGQVDMNKPQTFFGSLANLFGSGLSRFGQLLQKPVVSPLVQQFAPQLPGFVQSAQDVLQQARDVGGKVGGLFQQGQQILKDIPRKFQK